MTINETLIETREICAPVLTNGGETWIIKHVTMVFIEEQDRSTEQRRFYLDKRRSDESKMKAETE